MVIKFPMWVGPPTPCATRTFRLVHQTWHGVVAREVIYDVKTGQLSTTRRPVSAR